MNRMGRRYGFCSQDAPEDELDLLALQIRTLEKVVL
jgi:hypothetical protein